MGNQSLSQSQKLDKQSKAEIQGWTVKQNQTILWRNMDEKVLRKWKEDAGENNRIDYVKLAARKMGE